MLLSRLRVSLALARRVVVKKLPPGPAQRGLGVTSGVIRAAPGM